MDKRCGALAAVLLAGLAGHARADTVLDKMGGGGGGDFTARCPAGQLLAGFAMRAADDVDAIRPLCVTAWGPRDISAASDSAWHGGGGGRDESIACPHQTPIVHGMYVMSEGADTQVINSIHLSCALAADSQVTSKDTVAFFDAPAYYNSQLFATDPHWHGQTQYCPDGQLAVGMHGRSGVWVDAIGLICAPPDMAHAPVRSIGRAGGSPEPGPPKSICQAARDARARNSPAAANLEAQCAAIPPIPSIGRVPGLPGTDKPMTLCQRAKDARERNSPVAAHLEDLCRQQGGP